MNRLEESETSGFDVYSLDPKPHSTNGSYQMGAGQNINRHDPISALLAAFDLSRPKVGSVVFSSPLDGETLFRKSAAVANAFEARNRGYRIRLHRAIEKSRAELKSLAGGGESPSGASRIAALAVVVAALVIALIGSAAWLRWILNATNDPYLAGLVALMLPVFALGLHYWVWRSQLRARARAMTVITVCLVISGTVLLGAVAQRYGLVGAENAAGLDVLTAVDDNRWVMIPADFISVFGSALLMGWSEEIGESRANRLRNRIAECEAELDTLNKRSRWLQDKALRTGIKAILGAYRKIV